MFKCRDQVVYNGVVGVVVGRCHGHRLDARVGYLYDVRTYHRDGSWKDARYVPEKELSMSDTAVGDSSVRYIAQGMSAYPVRS